MEQETFSEEYVQQELEAREQARNDEIYRQSKMRAVDFGLQVRSFIEGPIGRRLAADALAELDEIGDRMLDLDVDREVDRDEFRELRHRARVLREWQVCLKQYMSDGENAEKELQALD